MGKEKRMKPYAPNFNMIAANIADPPVGASTCTSGNQVCTGHMGTLTAKAAKKAKKMKDCAVPLIGNAYQVAISKLPLDWV